MKIQWALAWAGLLTVTFSSCPHGAQAQPGPGQRQLPRRPVGSQITRPAPASLQQKLQVVQQAGKPVTQLQPLVTLTTAAPTVANLGSLSFSGASEVNNERAVLPAGGKASVTIEFKPPAPGTYLLDAVTYTGQTNFTGLGAHSNVEPVMHVKLSNGEERDVPAPVQKSLLIPLFVTDTKWYSVTLATDMEWWFYSAQVSVGH